MTITASPIITRRAAALYSGAALLALVAASPARAADEATAANVAAADAEADASYGEPILVTARRREESAQDVPIALSVVSAATLEDTGNFTIQQIQQLVPSLQITATNQRNSNINIRGLGANGAIAIDGLEYGVGFYVDGVYYARPGQSQFDLVDLERVEVLRGPQGTLFGKNTTAGAINITTRLPSFTPELTVEGNVGTYGYHQVRASGSIPIIDDKVAVRISVADTHRDSFITNIFDGRPGQNYDNFSVRGQLLVKPSQTFSVRIIGDYSKQQQFAIGSPDGYFSTYANGATIPNNIFDRAARNNYTLLPGDAFLRLADLDAPYGHKMESYGVSGEINWDLGRSTLTSISAYRWWDWYPANDIDGTSLSVFTKGQALNFQRQFSQELRLASNGTNTIDYQVGLFYFQQIIRGYGTTGYGPLFGAWNNSAPAVALALNDLEVGTFSDPSTKSYAAFGQADWKITDALTLTAGLRFTHEDKKGEFRQFWVPGTGVDLATLSPAQIAGVLAVRNAGDTNREFSFSATEKDDALSGLVTLGYKIAPDVLVYGSYQRGSKSGGLVLTNAGRLRPVVNPEKVDAFEVGVKSQFADGKVTLNVTAFHTEIRDYQANVLEPILNADGLATGQFAIFIDNIPKVRSRGFEGDLTIAPSQWFSFSASAAFTDAKFISFLNGQQAPERTNEGPVQDLSGVRLPGTPKFAYSLALNAAQPLGGFADFGDLEIYSRADFTHRSTYNSSSNNSIYGIIPAYGVLHARIGLRTADRVWDLSAWVRNLTDTKYYNSRSAAATGLISAQVGEPRTWGATLRAKF
jgi:iron complex outermembrane recepter protein